MYIRYTRVRFRTRRGCATLINQAYVHNNRHRYFKNAFAHLSSKNTQIFIPEAAGSALFTPLAYRPPSLSLCLFFLLLPQSAAVHPALLREFRYQARRKRSDSLVSGARLCKLLPHVCASGYAYKSGPPAREMYCEAEVASTYRLTSRPFRPTPSSSRTPRRTARLYSFPLSSAS